MDYLHRGQAHLPASLWQTIDEAAVKAARDKLTGRRFLDLEGPFGPGLTSIEVGNDDYCRQPAEGEAGAVDQRLGALILGQDLRAGYISQDGVHYHLFLSESIVLRIDEPPAICTIAARIRLDQGRGRARGEVVSGRRGTTEALVPSDSRENGQRS